MKPPKNSKKMDETFIHPFCLPGHFVLLREKKKGLPHMGDMPKGNIVCDYGLTRDYVLFRNAGAKQWQRKPSESVEAIHKWTGERQSKEWELFFESDRELTAALEVRSAVDTVAVDALNNKAKSLLDALLRLVENGNKHAIRCLVSTLNSGTGKLNKLVRARPEMFQPVARKFWFWPLAKSTHPKLSESNAILDDIQLGKDVGFQVDRHSKWKPDKAMDVAFALKCHIDFLRTNQRMAKDLAKLPFNSDNAPRLWEIAEAELIASYPHPEDVSEFLEIGIRKSKQGKSRSERRGAILEKIRARFIHLACQS